jgi:hypothetical protein
MPPFQPCIPTAGKAVPARPEWLHEIKYRAACNMGLEGMVSKRVDRPYRAGRSKDWVKVKNRNHPAMDRVMDSF